VFHWALKHKGPKLYSTFVVGLWCQTPSERRTNGQRDASFEAGRRVAATSTRRDGGDRGGRYWCAYVSSLFVRPSVRLCLRWVWHIDFDGLYSAQFISFINSSGFVGWTENAGPVIRRTWKKTAQITRLEIKTFNGGANRSAGKWRTKFSILLHYTNNNVILNVLLDNSWLFSLKLSKVMCPTLNSLCTTISTNSNSYQLAWSRYFNCIILWPWP